MLKKGHEYTDKRQRSKIQQKAEAQPRDLLFYVSRETRKTEVGIFLALICTKEALLQTNDVNPRQKTSQCHVKYHKKAFPTV